MDELYATLSGSTIYSLLGCTSGYHPVALSPEAQKKSSLMTPMDIFKFTREPFDLAQTLAHFLHLINDVFKGLSFPLGYFDDTLILSENAGKHFEHLKTVFHGEWKTSN